MSYRGFPASLRDANLSRLSKPSAVHLQTVHRRLAGRCRALLVTASDGYQYALKLIHPDCTPSMRASEALASLLASRLGLPVAEWAPIVVEGHLKRCYDLISMRSAVHAIGGPAVFYGSHIVTGERGELPYEIIPRSWHNRIVNRPDFVGMAIFDLWTIALHRRQVVYAPLDGGFALRAIFIDHCTAFGGTERREVTRPEDVLSITREIYGSLWATDVAQHWIARIQGITSLELEAVIDCLPHMWVTKGWREFVLSVLPSSGNWIERAAGRLTQLFREACRTGDQPAKRKPVRILDNGCQHLESGAR